MIALNQYLNTLSQNKKACYTGIFSIVILLCVIEFIIIQSQNATLQSKSTALNSLHNQLTSITKNYVTVEQTDASKELAILQSEVDGIDTTSSQYATISALIGQAKGLGIGVDQFNATEQSIAASLVSEKYTDASNDESKLTTQVNNAIQTKKLQQLAAQQAAIAQAKLAAQQAAQRAAQLALEKENAAISSVTGSHLIKTNISGFPVTYLSLDLSNKRLHIISDSANSGDCTNNCPVLDVMSYYNRNNAFAAVNGGYFCPISYPDCVSKTNSFDFPFYNSRVNKWINVNNILWIDRAAITFTGTTPHFYPNAAQMTTSNVTAGFVMAPGLIQNGQIIVQNYPLDAKSATVAAVRSAMGFNGSTLIIADIASATVPQSATVMQKLGMTNAIELDGGGSTALVYNGQYILGPGRSVPNAFVFALK